MADQQVLRRDMPGVAEAMKHGEEVVFIEHIKAVEGIEARDETGKISLNLNAACVREINEETGEVSDIVFLTTLDVSEKPAQIADYYGLRSNIENSGKGTVDGPVAVV